MRCKWCDRKIVKCPGYRSGVSVDCTGYIHKNDSMHYCGGIEGQPHAKAEPKKREIDMTTATTNTTTINTKRYAVIARTDDPLGFITECDYMVTNGWTPVGGMQMSVDTRVWTQTFVKGE